MGTRFIWKQTKLEKISPSIFWQSSVETTREAYLHQTATVKVGLDTSLKAWIQDALHLSPQESLNPPFTDNHARIISFGDSVNVEIEYSQEGVDYQLVTIVNDKETIISTGDKRGDLRNIVLQTNALYEDLDIRIRATKKFSQAENRDTQTSLLDIILPLRVRANTAQTTTPTQIIDYGQTSTISIANTQKSARYQLFIRTILDRDFVHGAANDSNTLIIKVDDEPDVHVTKPAYQEIWKTPSGFEALGEPQAGNGGDLSFSVPALTEDSLIIVQALKNHAPQPNPTENQTVISAVQLQATAVLLTRPNPDILLHLQVHLDQGNTDGNLQVRNGQPGVFYYFRKSTRGKVLGLPAYFHQTDDNDPETNKGLGQLKIGVDYVLTRPYPDSPISRAQATPPNPIINTGPLAEDSTLYIHAMKAQTRIEAKLNQTYTVPALPEIKMETAVLGYGDTTKILVIGSEAGYKYQPLLNGEPFIRARNGNGEDFSFSTDDLTADTTYEMLITANDENSTVADRTVNLFVSVLPNPALTVQALNETISAGAATVIQVEATQNSVQYQLFVNDAPLGELIAGNGGIISLPTGELNAETLFTVRATKINNAAHFVDLTQQVTIQIADEE